ncbi:MAG: glycogen/starch synthase [Roseivirga sp.]
MPKLRVLYVASEIVPFLQTSSVADFMSTLCHYMQEKEEVEIRILVPRFGLINEKKNRLHEVVRLSGVNITVGDKKTPLVIKVASIPNTRLQVYFIDSEEYFKRKAVFYDQDDQFFKDNGERIIFFCKGALETAKKLEWSPDIIHCHDWIASLVPMYLQTIYRNEPILKKAKALFTLYNNTFTHLLEKDLAEKVGRVGADALAPLATADFKGLIQTGIKHADKVTKAEALQDTHFKEVVDEKALTCIKNDEGGLATYYQLYQELSGKSLAVDQ